MGSNISFKNREKDKDLKRDINKDWSPIPMAGNSNNNPQVVGDYLNSEESDVIEASMKYGIKNFRSCDNKFTRSQSDHFFSKNRISLNSTQKNWQNQDRFSINKDDPSKHSNLQCNSASNANHPEKKDYRNNQDKKSSKDQNIQKKIIKGKINGQNGYLNKLSHNIHTCSLEKKSKDKKLLVIKNLNDIKNMGNLKVTKNKC